jgi:type VI secretion system protein VasD
MSDATLLTQRIAGAARVLLLSALCLAVAACGVSARIGKRVDDTWAGDMLFKSDDKVVLTTDAGNGLNPDASGTPLSVVVRVYQLTSLERFASADADSLWDNPKQALGNTLLDSQEVVLLPGFGQVNRWPLAPAAGFVGVAAFFRDTVHDSHWKAAFAADSWRKDGIWFSTKGSRVLIDNNQILAVGGGDLLRPADTPQRLQADNTMLPTAAQKLQSAAIKTSEDAASDSVKQSIDTKASSLVDSLHE